MINLIGSKIKFNFDNFIHVSDLIYVEGPLLSDYVNERGDHYLFYWVDADNEYNRWLVFRIDITTIQDYLNKKIAFNKVIANANDGFVISVDVSDDLAYYNKKLVLVNDIPLDYLPEIDSYYDFEVVDDLDIMSLSKKYNSGILDIHLDGDNIKYGSMNFNMFSESIIKFVDITSAMSTKFIKKVSEDIVKDEKNTKSKGQRKSASIIKMDVADKSNFDIVNFMTGSVRVILRPETSETHFAKSYSDLFAEDIIELFESSKSHNAIELFAQKYDKNIIKKFSELIRYLNEQKMSIGVQWGNIQSNSTRKHFISKNETSTILQMLDNIDYNEEKEFEVIGKFYSINTRTGKFSFEESDGKNTYSGDFIKNMQKYIFTISFSEEYKIVINRKISEAVGNKKNIKDTITSLSAYNGNNIIHESN